MFWRKNFPRILAILLVAAAFLLTNAVAYANTYDVIQEYTARINYNSFDAVAYNNRGVAYQELGNMILAQADFAKANEMWYAE